MDLNFLETVGKASSPGAQDVIQPPKAPPSEVPIPTSKRTYSSISEYPLQEGFADEARSVALDLGLLTLNSDSRQTHYLGTSSGRLFTSLIGAGSPEAALTARSGRTPDHPPFHSPGNNRPIAHDKKSKESYRLLYDALRKNLPSEEDAQVLLEAYFRNIHVDHPFMHPGSLISAVSALYKCAASDATTEIGHNGWLHTIEPFTYNGEFDILRNDHCTPVSVFTATFHVFMVFTLAATVRTRQRIYDFAPNQFYRVAMSTSQHCFSNTSTASLQATLLLAAYSLLGPAELNIWTLTYVAMAHCIDLGLHRTPSADSDMNRPAFLTRKMLFFSVYHLDRSIAAVQGRPLGIRDETFDLELPSFADADADVKSIQDREFAPDMSFSGCLAFAIHRFKLDPIISEIKLLFYHLPSQVSAYAWPQDHQSAQATIQHRLQNWRHDLSTIAGTLIGTSEDDKLEHRKYELKLTSQYFAAMILLYQPSQTIRQPCEQSLLICYQCAASRLNTYNDLYYAESFYQSWRSVQGIFSSGATMIYCLWTSALVRNTVSTAETMRDLRTCMNLLSVGGEWWPSVKKGKESFVRAMDALLQTLEPFKGHNSLNTLEDGQPRSRRNFATTRPPPVPSMTNVQAGMMIQNLHGTLETPDENGTNFYHMASDFTTSDWTILDDPAFHHHSHGILDVDPDIGTNSTVEAFIAEFLNNDTSWNPF